MDNYAFVDFYQRLVISVSKDENKYNYLCKGAYNNSNYTGDNLCAYNIAMSFLKTKSFLEKEISKKSDNWKWKNVHVNEYSN